MDEKKKHVNKDIIALPTPPSPPLNQVSSSPSQPSQVHPSHIQPPASASTAPKRQQLCKRCGHPRKGHTYPKNSAVRCPRCSNGVCATHDTCTSTQKHSTALQPTLHYGHIAEYILPYHLSKATIFGFPIGSNACTAIAAVGAMKFLHGELPMPSPQGIMNTIALFANTMRDGNIHYNSLAMPSHQPNLDAREALQTRQDNFGLTISQDIGIVSPASLTNELNHICRSEENLCAILITPPDKSMLLCFSNEQNKIALFDSHQHGSYGGLIAVATYAQVDNFVSFLSYMCARDWGSGIPGANLAVLTKR